MKRHLNSSENRSDREETYLQRSLCFALAFIGIVSGGCTALPDRMETASVTSTVSGYPAVATGGQQRFENKTSKGAFPAKVAKASYSGNAPYICTPSGFGRKSGCFLRG